MTRPYPILSEPSGDRWLAVTTRDASCDGSFFYGVMTTGVYCKPSCPSRGAKRENVRFFDTRDAARQAGLRACKRCKPDQQDANDWIEPLCRYIEANLESPLTLEALGKWAGLSPFHLQRVFKARLGVSPKQYADALRMRHFKKELAKGSAVTEAIYASGYGSSSRVYEKSDGSLGMKPVEYRKGASGVAISYSTVQSPLGLLLVAATDRGLCQVALADTKAELVGQLQAEFPAATLTENREAIETWAAALCRYLDGGPLAEDLPLDVRATAFQKRVWEYLRGIPAGETRSYARVAEDLGNPRAARAVARACATNRLALAIPCHRVIRGTGELGGYRWGLERKRQLLATERANAQ